MDTKVKGTCQQKIKLFQIVKIGQLLHQGKWLTKSQVQQKFPHLMGELNAMETIASYGGRIDPGGYRWPPTIPMAQNNYFRLAFLAIFRVLNFRGHFEVLNNIFLASFVQEE